MRAKPATISVTLDASRGVDIRFIDSPEGSHSMPILKITTPETTGTFAGWDVIRHNGRLVRAGQLVFSWILEPGRTDDEAAWGALFLSQCPNLPISTREAAQLMGISPAGVKSLIERGRIPARLVGGASVLLLDDVMASRSRRGRGRPPKS